MLDYFALALRLNGIVAHSIVHAQNQKSILIEFSFALLDFHPFFYAAAIGCYACEYTNKSHWKIVWIKQQPGRGAHHRHYNHIDR